MDVGLLTLLYFGLLVLCVALGLPVAFSIGGTAVIFILWQLGSNCLLLVAISAWEAWTSHVMIAIPLFVLMAYLLQGCGMADDLFEMMYRWMGPVGGGLGMGTVVICTIFAAMAGMSALGTITMGLIALPAMMKRGYDKRLALGCIGAGGTLGILIPPSLPMIIYGFLAQESVGQLFLGGIIPGIILSTVFIVYIGLRCIFNRSVGPAVPKEERFTWRQKFASLRSMVLPLILIFMVLGFIYLGIATPTEAAGVGAMGAFIIVLIYRRFSWNLLRDSLIGTLRITAMAGWIILGAMLFTHVYATLGASQFLQELTLKMGLNRWLILALTQVTLFILGCFMDPTGMMVITLPIFVPLIRDLGFSAVWFGVLFVINMEMGYLTPPFGYNLFYMKLLAPKTATMQDIYMSVIPFILLEWLVLILMMAFPNIIMWLPEMMIAAR